MENQFCSPAPLHGWPSPSSYMYLPNSKSIEELKSSLLYTAMELEAAKLTTQEELRRRDEELTNLRNLLAKAIRERNDAQEKCHNLHLENMFLLQTHHQLPLSILTAPVSGSASAVEDDDDDDDLEPPPQPPYNKLGLLNNNNNNRVVMSSSDCEESSTTTTTTSTTVSSNTTSPPSSATENYAMLLPPNKPLPEKGRLLQAVIKAGPLLQTLMLAGPLPQWRHPPPPIKSFEIPLVGIGSPLPPANDHQKGSCIIESHISRPYKYYHRSISNSSE